MSKEKRYVGRYYGINFLGSKPNPNTEYVKSKDKHWERVEPNYEIWVEKDSIDDVWKQKELESES